MLAHGINKFGQLVGHSQEGPPNLYSHAVMWQGTALARDLGFMGTGSYSAAYGTNDLGDIVGIAHNGTAQHGFRWHDGHAIELGRLPGGTISVAYGMNDNGQIVGEANTGGFGPFHAVLWTVTSTTGVGSNTPPSVGLAAVTAVAIGKGGSVTVRGSFTDPDQGDGPWSHVIDWGNGTTVGTAAAPGIITASRPYARTGLYSIRFKVTDARGAAGTSGSVDVRVR